MDASNHGSQFQKFVKCHWLFIASALCWVSAVHNVQVGLLLLIDNDFACCLTACYCIWTTA